MPLHGEACSPLTTYHILPQECFAVPGYIYTTWLNLPWILLCLQNTLRYLSCSQFQVKWEWTTQLEESTHLHRCCFSGSRQWTKLSLVAPSFSNCHPYLVSWDCICQQIITKWSFNIFTFIKFVSTLHISYICRLVFNSSTLPRYV